MGHSQAERAASRECMPRIVAHKVRAEGMTRPGIADLTKEAGLTHGDFCKHGLVTLGAAAGRSDRHFKTAYEKQVRAYLDLIAGLGDDEQPQAGPMLTLSALAGAMLISRAVADPEFSGEILEEVGEQLKRPLPFRS